MSSRRLYSSFAYSRFNISSLKRLEISTLGSLNYRLFFQNISDNKLVSPWHDIPLDLNSFNGRDIVLPFVCEIPRGKTEKMEVSLSEKFNPIAQDIDKGGKCRYLSIKPKFNYGMFPATFENPDKNCFISGVPGDGDPIDVVDISVGGEELKIGSIVPVKVLGSFCFIDGGQADWKIIVTRNDAEERVNKEVLSELFGFFENYKKDSNNYIFDNRKVFGVGDTLEVLKCAHSSYEELVLSYRTMRGRGESDEKEPVNIWVPGMESI